MAILGSGKEAPDEPTPLLASTSLAVDDSPAWQHRDRLHPGTHAGSFVIERFMAEGGCGQVYAARHLTSGRAAAVKVLHWEMERHERVVARFLREVDVIKLLRHPDIIEILEVGTLADGGPFYAMEHLDGESLSAVLLRQGSLSLDEALGVLEPVCSALAAAHAAGVVHRDVKASNIFVLGGHPLRVKLLDFGIAKLLPGSAGGSSGLTSVGSLVGTPSIMAPEQILGGPIDERVDIYALGALLFRMLTGRQPFSSVQDLGVVQQHLEAPAPRPSDLVRVPPGIDAVVLRCLEKQPERRFPSVEEFIDAVREAAGQPTGSGRPGAGTRALGVGLHIGLHIDGDIDFLETPMSSDLGSVLQLAETVVQRGGYTLLLATETDVFGVRRLPEDPSAAEGDKARARELLLSIKEALDRRPDADPHVRVTLRMYVDELIFSEGPEPEVIGGALTEPRLWLPGRIETVT